MNCAKKLLFPLLLSFAVPYTSASLADAIKEGCVGDFDIESNGGSKIENTLVINSEDSNGPEVTLTVKFFEGPVDASSWLVLHINSGAKSQCYVVHSGTQDSKDPPGFNDVLADKAFYRDNSSGERLEIFVPVTAYPFAGDEDHSARLIEININSDLKPSIVDGEG